MALRPEHTHFRLRATLVFGSIEVERWLVYDPPHSKLVRHARGREKATVFPRTDIKRRVRYVLKKWPGVAHIEPMGCTR